MSTNSIIGVTNKDGSVDSVHCHFDGHVIRVGAKLQKHFLDEAKVRLLIELGDILSLGYGPDTCELNHDGGDGGLTKHHVSVDEFKFWSNHHCGLTYLFTDGVWEVSTWNNEPFQPLLPLLQDEKTWEDVPLRLRYL